MLVLLHKSNTQKVQRFVLGYSISPWFRLVFKSKVAFKRDCLFILNFPPATRSIFWLEDLLVLVLVLPI